VSRPVIVVEIGLTGHAVAYVRAGSAEGEAQLRAAIVSRGDLIPEIAIAVAEALDVLDQAAEEDAA
jgi:hypothetical protein